LLCQKIDGLLYFPVMPDFRVEIGFDLGYFVRQLIWLGMHSGLFLRRRFRVGQLTNKAGDFANRLAVRLVELKGDVDALGLARDGKNPRKKMVSIQRDLLAGWAPPLTRSTPSVAWAIAGELRFQRICNCPSRSTVLRPGATGGAPDC